MKNLKRFTELNESDPRRVNDGEENSEQIDSLLTELVSTVDKEDGDDMDPKVALLIVYMNLKLSAEEREEIKKNI